MGEKRFTDFEWERVEWANGVHGWVKLDNGWVVSCVRHDYSYGNRNGEGLYEVAALWEDELQRLPDEADQVKGWLDEDGVQEFMDKVATLKPGKVQFKSIAK
jgi:hypothetical protein